MGTRGGFCRGWLFFLSNFFQIVVKRTNIGFTVVSTSRCGPAARCAFTLPTPGLPRLPEAKPCAHWTPPPLRLRYVSPHLAVTSWNTPTARRTNGGLFTGRRHGPQAPRHTAEAPGPLPLAQPGVRMPAGGCERKSEAVWCQILEIIPASAGGTGSRGPPSRHVQRPREEEMVLGALRG